MGIVSLRGRTVVFLGKRGVGKSSTLNYLFGFNRPTDAAVESTVKPYAQTVRSAAGKRYRIVDMPGIAADIDSYGRYGRYYRRWVRSADTVIWITQSNVGAYKQDQIFFRDYSCFARPATRLVLALSKADKQVANLSDLTSPEMPEYDLIRRKAKDASSQILPFTWADPESVTVVPYSIVKRWNTENLRSAILAIP